MRKGAGCETSADATYDGAMKVFVSADIEGICGITDWAEADKTHRDYLPFAERMSDHVGAVCAALWSDARVEDVLVRDAHGSGRNIDATLLPRPTRLIRGWSGDPMGMVEGLDRAFGAACFVGYHARAGGGGNPLAHTWSSSTLQEVVVNGEPVSEYRLNAWASASISVPVMLVSGDAELCAEVSGYDDAIVTVPVIEGYGASTRSLHPDEARERLDSGVREALRRIETTRYRLEVPRLFEVALEYKDHRSAYRKSFYPGAHLVSPKVVGFETDAIYEVLRLIQFAT